MEDKIFYGQVISLFQVDIPATLHAHSATSDTTSHAPRSLLLALIAPAKVESKNKLNMPYFKQLGTSLILDVTCIEELVGRVPASDPRGYWACVQRTGAVELFDEAGDQLENGCY